MAKLNNNIKNKIKNAKMKIRIVYFEPLCIILLYIGENWGDYETLLYVCRL